MPFWVYGHDRDTEERDRFFSEAASEDAARAEAVAQGMIVESVSPFNAEPPVESPTSGDALAPEPLSRKELFIAQQKTACPDCHCEMRPIKLIDRGDCDVHQQLGYAAGEAERGWFLGRYPEEGKVAARMCPSCGKIVLHGEPT